MAQALPVAVIPRIVVAAIRDCDDVVDVHSSTHDALLLAVNAQRIVTQYALAYRLQSASAYALRAHQ